MINCLFICIVFCCYTAFTDFSSYEDKNNKFCLSNIRSCFDKTLFIKNVIDPLDLN